MARSARRAGEVVEVIRGLVFAALCVHLVAIELWLLGRLDAWVPDFAALLLVFALVDLRVSRAVWIVLPIALGRALLMPGGTSGTSLDPARCLQRGSALASLLLRGSLATADACGFRHGLDPVAPASMGAQLGV